MELHHPIMSKLWDLGGQTKRKERKKPVIGNSNYWYLVDIIMSVNAEDQEDVD